MDLIELVTHVSQDADPGRPGFQAHISYVLLNVAFPLLVGMFVGIVLRTFERLFGLGIHGGEH